MDFLKLIRYKNLLFTLLLQLLVYYCLISPTEQMFGMHTYAPSWAMILAIVSTTLIAAGGYIINDYFDIKIDRINHPGSVIVSNTISKHAAMHLYQAVTAIGVAGGLVSAFFLRSFTLGFIFLIVPGMLWFYSATYKRQLIIGNIIVSLAAALVPMIPLIGEVSCIEHAYPIELLQQTPVLYTLYAYVCAMSLFAFIFTFAREVIKDLQDIAGDREMECHTIAVVWGKLAGKIIAAVLIVIANLLCWQACSMLPFPGTLCYKFFIFGIALPSLCAICILFSRSCTAYSNASDIVKFTMAIGSLFPIIYYYLIAANYHIPFLGIFQIMQNA